MTSGRPSLLLFLLLVAAGSLTACRGRDVVRVRVTFDSPAGARPLANVTVFAGANKSSWPTLSPGEMVSVVLPPEGEPPEVTLTYTLGPAPRSWRGPPMPVGVGYAIGIRIDSNGTVTEHHCQSPCDLP